MARAIIFMMAGMMSGVMAMMIALSIPASLFAGDDLPTEARIIGADRFVDSGGREIRVTKPFKRVISLYGAHTENLFALGAGEAVIGVSRSEDYPPDALLKPAFSYHDDPERFLAARPDLALIRPMIDRGYYLLISRLEKSGITVVSLQPATAGEMYDYWRILGMLTGRMANAERMVDDFTAAVDGIARRSAAIPDKKRVYFEAIHSRMKTFSPDSIAMFALATAGGVNIAADAAPSRGTNIANYGKEKILARADSIDVYIAQSGAMNQPTLEMIRKEPGFSVIRAVREGRIHILPEQIVARPTPRLLEGIKAIALLLYPERFSDLGSPETPSGAGERGAR